MLPCFPRFPSPFLHQQSPTGGAAPYPPPQGLRPRGAQERRGPRSRRPGTRPSPAIGVYGTPIPRTVFRPRGSERWRISSRGGGGRRVLSLTWLPAPHGRANGSHMEGPIWTHSHMFSQSHFVPFFPPVGCNARLLQKFTTEHDAAKSLLMIRHFRVQPYERHTSHVFGSYTRK